MADTHDHAHAAHADSTSTPDAATTGTNVARAAEQLGSTSLAVRLRAIATLERLAADPQYRRPVVMLLTGYIQEAHPRHVDADPALHTLPRDIQAIMAMLGRRTLLSDEQRLDLRDTDLRLAILPGANLNHADFRGATLSHANLSGADLREANFSWADLSSATLSRATLAGAILRETNLTCAGLGGAVLDSAILAGAGIQGADLTRATLVEADLSGADLSKANLAEANLAGANLAGANLSGARLRKAGLRHASFSATTLRDADLRKADLRGARNLTVQQLQTTASIREALLPPDLEAELRNQQ